MVLIYPIWDIYLEHVLWPSCEKQGDHWLLGDEKSRFTPHENGSTSGYDEICDYDPAA